MKIYPESLTFIELMIRTIILLYFLSAIQVNFSQSSCEDSIFYNLALDKMYKNEIRYNISFQYDLSEFTKKGLFESSMLSDKDKSVIKKELSLNNFIPCGQLKKKVSKLGNRPLDKKQRYTIMNFSKPIFVSKSKVYLFSEALIMQKNYTGIRGGGSIMQTFIKINGDWTLSDKKILEMY